MPKHITDSQLLTALLVHGGVTKAAAALNISRPTIYKRLQDPAFRAQYDSAQGVLLSVAATSMSDALDDAIGALREVITDKNANVNARIAASDSLLRHCAKYCETASICRRLDALEKQNQQDY